MKFIYIYIYTFNIMYNIIKYIIKLYQNAATELCRNFVSLPQPVKDVARIATEVILLWGPQPSLSLKIKSNWEVSTQSIQLVNIKCLLKIPAKMAPNKRMTSCSYTTDNLILKSIHILKRFARYSSQKCGWNDN